MYSIRTVLFGLIAVAVFGGSAPLTVQAQDGPAHGTVQSTSEGTAVIQLNKGYRVESGTKGKIFEQRKTFGKTTTVKIGIRVTKVDGRTVTAKLLEGSKVDQGQDVQFANVRKVGTLVVRPQPETAQVFLDGESLGQGTVRRTLGTGPHRVRVAAEGHNAEEMNVLVKAGQTVDRTVQLEQQVGRLTVTTSPSSAQLEIDTDEFTSYEEIGQTPVRGYELAAGSYDLRISKEGYQTETHTVSLEAGMLTEKSYTLKKAVGTLIVESNPSGADVYVDGDYEGTTQFEVEVEPGSYEIEVRESGYEPETQYKRVTAGERQRVYFDLQQETATTSTFSGKNVSNKEGGKSSFPWGNYLIVQGFGVTGAVIGGATSESAVSGVVGGLLVGWGVGGIIVLIK